MFIHEPKPIINIDDPATFVRQQYLDILRREPDPAGLQAWVTQLTDSEGGANKDSVRVNVSLAILDSPEFHDGGYFVIRLYLATLGRPPLREEFGRDHDAIFGASTSELESKKAALIAEFVERPEFKSKYGGLSNDHFVKVLLATATYPSPKLAEELVSQLESKQQTRAQVVRGVVDHTQTIRAFRNHVFVLMQFFAHLGRDPKTSEYNDRLKTLDATGDYHQLIFDFLYSVEYRKRFGYVN